MSKKFKPLRWGEYGIQKPNYFQWPQPDTTGKYDVVKYVHHTDTREVTEIVLDGDKPTTRKKIVTPEDEYCYVLATIEYDPDEDDYDFRSVGLRFLEDYKEGLSEWVLGYLKKRLPYDRRALNNED